MKLLLAEDDRRFGELLTHLLTRKAGCRVEWVTHGEAAVEFCKQSHFDVVILDWMMPKVDGVTVCRRLRKEGYTGAILLLTARDTTEDRVEGLDAGADDYLVKPFEFEELLARLRALCRRNFAPLVEDKLKVGNLVLNRTNYTVQRNDEEIQLTPREFQLLDLLIQNKGHVLTRELILDRIWGYDSEVTNNTIDVYIKLLRKKLGMKGKKTLIHSVRGVGYKFESFAN